MMTVFVLTVLWLIVVVPMLVRRSDLRRRERSVDGFGRAMRALGRRTPAARADARSEVFVPRERRAPAPAPARRPVPAPQEALMFPVDRSQLSAPRAQMMRRRRRSLTILTAGTALFGILALALGGTLWLLEAPFLIASAGYVYFLRTQARRDRDRRDNRQQHARTARSKGYDATDTEQIARFEEAPSSMVRIDDDDIELHNMDTIDLTGLYNEELAAEAAVQRRAS
jgi:membrane protein implicated in regulation of membrane protease activity